MRTVSIFRNNRNQAVRLPRDLEFHGVTELTIERRGDMLDPAPGPPELDLLRRRARRRPGLPARAPDLIEQGRFDLGDDDPAR